MIKVLLWKRKDILEKIKKVEKEVKVPYSKKDKGNDKLKKK